MRLQNYYKFFEFARFQAKKMTNWHLGWTEWQKVDNLAEYFGLA